jgi:hypothetical protein
MLLAGARNRRSANGVRGMTKSDERRTGKISFSFKRLAAPRTASSSRRHG